jgi:hypothetical protein
VSGHDDALAGVERWRLFATAIAGRSVDVIATEPGDPAWTDGTTIFVDGTAGAIEQIHMVGVQASLIAGGSFAPPVLRQLTRRPKLAPRYLAVEGHRALAANADVLPPMARSLIDREIASKLRSAEESLAFARNRPAIEVPASFGAIRARRVLASLEREAAPSQPEAIRRDLTELVDEPDDESEDRISSPVEGGGAIGRQLRRLLRSAKGRDGGPPGAEAPTHFTKSPPRGGTGTTAVSMKPAGTTDGADVLTRDSASYPEWDVHRGQYRQDWCTVLESDPPMTGRPGPMADDLGLRRPLARLGLELTPCRRQPEGDDIDLDAAVEAWVDRFLGAPHDTDCYVATLRRRRDLAALVLLDVSGSAGEPGVSGKPVHEHQRSAAAALTVALHELGDRVALYAFNSRGRTAVQFMRVKHFDDHLDGHVAGRLDAVTPGAYTRLGAAIRHGTAVLEARGGTPRRLLVVLSDGFAYDHGYEGRYGESDARRALVEARRRGVGCLCVSVGAVTEPAALRRVFGAAAHATVARPDELRAVIGPLFRAALASAELQRRTFQRKERRRDGSAVLRAGR